MSKTKRRPSAGGGGGGEGGRRGGLRPGAGRPFGSGTVEARVDVPLDLADPLGQLGDFLGIRPQDIALLILRGIVRELHRTIGDEALRRFARLEAARLLKGMDDGQRRLAHYKFVTRPGLALDVAEDEWAEVLELADATPAGRIVAEIDALRQGASAALARLACAPLPSSN